MIAFAIVAAVLAGVPDVNPTTLYLTCEVVRKPTTTVKDIYRAVPASSDQISRDLERFPLGLTRWGIPFGASL